VPKYGHSRTRPPARSRESKGCWSCTNRHAGTSLKPSVSHPPAKRALELIGRELGIWRIGLAELVKGTWPDEVVLMPALGGSKTRREEQLRGLERLRQIGALEGDR
jgi:hypothetical protein